MAKGTLSSGHNRIDAHRNSQGQGQHAQGLRRFKSDGVPVLKEEVEKGSYS